MKRWYRTVAYYVWLAVAALEFVAIYDGHTCWFTQLQYQILFHAVGCIAAVGVAFHRRPPTRSNHLCWCCKQDCDCPGLHMMTDCEACGSCRSWGV